MRLIVVIILCVLTCLFNCSTSHEPKLESLTFTNDMLYEWCTLSIIPKEDRSKLPTNSYITSDRKYVRLITNGALGDMGNIETVERILYSVYEEETEVGVIAFQFNDNTVAEDAKTTLLQINSKAIFRNGCIVVVIWDDGVTAGCSSRIIQIVMSALDLNNGLTLER